MRTAAAFLATFVVCAPAFAQDAAVAIAGQVQHPQSLTVAELQKLPRTEVQISFDTDKGPESATYTGALLWAVISNASPVDASGKNMRIRHTYLVTARDGYAAALSDGEIDPKLEGKMVLLAYEKDGKPIDSIRLVVPGDHHGARAVRDVARIDVQ